MDILNDKRFMRTQKAKIIQTVETQWDEYEDEYDDTYEDSERIPVNPVNPRLKMIHDDVEEETAESELDEDVEGVLYKWFKINPAVFDRDARKKKEREQLKQETRWTDEQLEGWKSIADRDPSILRKLERKYEKEVFKQREVQSTKWSAGDDVAGNAQGSSPGTRGTSGRGRGGKKEGSRGRGRGRDVERGRARKDRIRFGNRSDA
jgi:activating signal cointegrator complex subunit 2